MKNLILDAKHGRTTDHFKAYIFIPRGYFEDGRKTDLPALFRRVLIK